MSDQNEQDSERGALSDQERYRMLMQELQQSGRKLSAAARLAPSDTGKTML